MAAASGGGGQHQRRERKKGGSSKGAGAISKEDRGEEGAVYPLELLSIKFEGSETSRAKAEALYEAVVKMWDTTWKSKAKGASDDLDGWPRSPPALSAPPPTAPAWLTNVVRWPIACDASASDIPKRRDEWKPEWVGWVDCEYAEGRMCLPARDLLPNAHLLCLRFLIAFQHQPVPLPVRISEKAASSFPDSWGPVVRHGLDVTGVRWASQSPAVFCSESVRFEAARRGERSLRAKMDFDPTTCIRSCAKFFPTVSTNAMAVDAFFRCGINNFCASTAIAVYNFFDATSVIDPSAGWGDRMAAAVASPRVRHYRGVDPNLKLAPAFRRLSACASCIDAVQRPDEKRAFEFINRPAEEALFEDDPHVGTFDLCFTSPPYFDQEVYDADSPTQSTTRYPEIDDWMEKFWRPYVKGCLRNVRAGGHVAFMMENSLRASKAWVNRAIRIAQRVSVDHKKLGAPYVIAVKYCPRHIPIWVFPVAEL